MKQKGQALVEFILIMPLIILISISLIDIGNIFIHKYELNNTLETVCELYKNDALKELNAYVAKENIEYTNTENNNLITITIQQNIKINAPVLSNILGKNHKIKAKKTFYIENDKENQNE